VTGLGLLITVSFSLLFALLLECFILLVLELLGLVSFSTLSQYVLASFPGIEKGLVECRITLLAHVRLWDVVLEDWNSNANVMLPDAALVARNPWLVVVVTCLNSTTNATNDFDLFFLRSSLLRLLCGFLFGFGRLVEEVETLRVLALRSADGPSGFIWR
jgi:hypothetical protein